MESSRLLSPDACPTPAQLSTNADSTNFAQIDAARDLFLMFWNVYGIRNFFSYLNDFETDKIFCLTETLHTKSPQNVNSFSHLKLYESFAIKNFTVGRPSGGLVIAHSIHLDSVMLVMHTNWIVIKISLDDYSIIVINAYINPRREDILKPFFEMLSDLLLNNLDKPIFIGGDFNSQIKNENQLPDNVILSQNLLDDNVNKMGTILIEGMEEREFLVLNGRTIDDRPAQFTYCSKLGKSVIDLLWLNEPAVELFSKFHVILEIN